MLIESVLLSSFNRSYLFFYKDNEVKVARQESVDDDKKTVKNCHFVPPIQTKKTLNVFFLI